MRWKLSNVFLVFILNIIEFMYMKKSLRAGVEFSL